MNWRLLNFLAGSIVALHNPILAETNIIEGSWLEFSGPDDLRLDPSQNVIAVDVGGFVGNSVINGVTFKSDLFGPQTSDGVTVSVKAPNIHNPWSVLSDINFTGNDQESTERFEQVMQSIRWSPAPGTLELLISGLNKNSIYQIQLLFADVRNDRHWDIGVQEKLLVDDWTSRGPTQNERTHEGNNGFAYSVNLSADENGEIKLKMGKDPFPQDPANSPPNGVDNKPLLNAVIINEVASFQYVEGNFSWSSAINDSRARGGRLAILDTPKKQSLAERLLADIPRGQRYAVWIGARRVNSAWKWLDGSPLSDSFRNWTPGRPQSTFLENRNYVAFSLGGDRFNSRFGQWIDFDPFYTGNVSGYLLEALPLVLPILEIDSFYESPPNESIDVYATPSGGNPTDFTYQWFFNNLPIPEFLGGNQPIYSLTGDPEQNGTWTVVVTNSAGASEASFEYRVIVDNDSDGLSNYREENITLTNPNLSDSDQDGLSDFQEVSVHKTNPNEADEDQDGLNDSQEITANTNPIVADTDNDGLLDGAEVNTYASNPTSNDTDGDGIHDATEIDAGLDINKEESIADAVRILLEARNTAISERNTRPTFEELKDGRLGSVILFPDVTENKVRLRFCIEESNGLGQWITREEEAEVDIPLAPGKKFFRFSVKENE